MKTKMGILILMLLSLLSIQATQTRVITGAVTSASDNNPLPGVAVSVKGTNIGTSTDGNGKYSIITPINGTAKLVFSFIGYQTKEVAIGTKNKIDVALSADFKALSEVVVVGYAAEEKRELTGVSYGVTKSRRHKKGNAEHESVDIVSSAPMHIQFEEKDKFNTEEYNGINENSYHDAVNNPLSTFSIDVDAASYSNVRRFINNGQSPPKEAVRIEEMINYFDYDYQQPTGDDPFSIYTEVAEAPWNTNHRLVHIGLQGKIIPTENLPASNLVFLIDVSGSMQDDNKLPLLKSSLKMLVDQLRPQDHVAMVVYAGAAGLVLPSTAGNEKKKIIDALDKLEAGGSTAGGAGIKLAYAEAKANFKENGNNRVILATDGDFNIGESSNGAMERLIEEKRKDGIFLTVLGYGMGNYKDAKMEMLADKGNGNYAYIDTILEAKKVLVNEFGGTLFTIAKDVKLQVEFNPVKVKAYRLIGYENRMLKSEDFNNDKKDAGELGSGHTVTALYEIIPVGLEEELPTIDPLKYQKSKTDKNLKYLEELMTIKFRYKKPNEDVSKLISQAVFDKQVTESKTSDNFRWSASVAGFGMLLRESEHAKSYSLEKVLKLAHSSKSIDKEGYRSEFINLVEAFKFTSTH